MIGQLIEPEAREAGVRNLRGAAPTIVPPNPPPNFRRIVHDDGVCILTFDRPGSSGNVFDVPALRDLLAEVECVASTPVIRGVIFTSAKDSIFIAGADLRTLSTAPPDQIRETIALGQEVMNRIADLQIPTVAAVHGAAMGGGYELCLACDYRVATDDKVTKLGLPETQIGLLPAWGGSTRLPRLIGLPKALEIILAGKTLAPKPALKRGMIDEVVPREYLMRAAERWLARGKRAPRHHLLLNNPVSAAVIRRRARAQVFQKTRGHYPAPLAALDVVTKGVSQTISESLRLEREHVLELIRGDACRNLIQIFFLQEKAKKRAAGGVPGKSIQRTAVIGGGVMGAGIAQWLASRGFPVILRDISVDQLARGMASISKAFQAGAKRRKFTPREAQAGLDRISPMAAQVPLANVDLVVEAAVEKMALKKSIFKDLDQRVSPGTILATNTSALSVTDLALATSNPERVIGLHFFNPVHRMQLVEVVTTSRTTDAVLQRAMAFVRQIGKLPVLVRDSPGFVVNRILMPYLVEAGNLLEGGASVEELDAAMLDFGMPMGPMRLLDEVGIDVALHVAETLAQHFGERLRIPTLLKQMVELGCLGRKTGRGFYLYNGADKIVVNPHLPLQPPAPSHPPLSRAELKRRMVLLMINESVRCLEEGIVAEAGDIDFAMVMGTGFAPFRGGPLRYADQVGAAGLVQEMDAWVARGAPQFEPAMGLPQLAKTGGKFYAAK